MATLMIDDCIKLTTYCGEADGGSMADKLLGIYADQRLAASVLLRGTEGFGRLHQLHTERLEVLMYDLPLVSIAIDTRERCRVDPRHRPPDRPARAPNARASAASLRPDRTDRARRATR